MSSRALPIIVANADFELEHVVRSLTAPAADRERFLKMCRRFRRRGIASLFLECSAALLHDDLQRSGTALLFFLKGAKDPAKATSEAGPFFDAVACKDWDTAREIARHARPTWNREEEYEDDFLYVWYLMKKFFLGESDAGLAAVLERYEAVLEGQEDVRFDLCKALQARDAAAFEAALEVLIDRHADHYRQAMAEARVTEEEWATEGQLYLEGMALVRLAERLGLPTQPGYRFIPSLALAGATKNLDPDSWRKP